MFSKKDLCNQTMDAKTPQLPYELWDLIFSFVPDYYAYYRVLPLVCKYVNDSLLPADA